MIRNTKCGFYFVLPQSIRNRIHMYVIYHEIPSAWNKPPSHEGLFADSGVGVRFKSGGINIEKIEGVGSGEGLCSPQLGVWGLPQKKN